MSVDPLSPEYPWYTPYQFAGNTPIQAIDLDGLEEYKVTYIYNNGRLIGLEIVLEDPNANYIIRRNRIEETEESRDYEDYIPPSSIDKAQEDGFFRLLRQNGVLGRILNNNRKAGPFRIPTPFRIPNRQQRSPLIPSLQLNELDIPPRELGISVVILDPPKPIIIDVVNSIVRYASWEDIPLNVSSVQSEIDGLITRLQNDPTLTINIEANIGGGRPSSDEKKQAVERSVFGRSALELAQGRRDKTVNEFRKRARRAGVDEKRITGTIGNKKERSVRYQVLKSRN